MCLCVYIDIFLKTEMMESYFQHHKFKDAASEVNVLNTVGGKKSRVNNAWISRGSVLVSFGF